MFEEYKIINCEPLDDYKVKIIFADGVSGTADLKHLAGKGVFKLWNDYSEFKKVLIHPITKTICWPDEIDLDPINLKNHLNND
jgi:hypothetical protein